MSLLKLNVKCSRKNAFQTTVYNELQTIENLVKETRKQQMKTLLATEAKKWDEEIQSSRQVAAIDEPLKYSRGHLSYAYKTKDSRIVVVRSAQNDSSTEASRDINKKYNEWKSKHLNLNDEGKAEDENEETFMFLITGGYRPTDKSLVKYIVSMRWRNERKFFGDSHFCGGSIIGKRVILTAAHCLFDNTRGKFRPNRIIVVAGTPRRLQKVDSTQILEIDAIRPHPKYSARNMVNDIGILKLKEDIKIDSATADIIKLPTTEVEPGTKCTVVGWGSVVQWGPSPDEAVFGDINILSKTFCERIEGFNKGMICAANPGDHEVDSCQGDSGGPLICNNKIVGIVSFGYGCGEPNSAGIYTDVHYFQQWIEENAAIQMKFRFVFQTSLYICLWHVIENILL